MAQINEKNEQREREQAMYQQQEEQNVPTFVAHNPFQETNQPPAHNFSQSSLPSNLPMTNNFTSLPSNLPHANNFSSLPSNLP